MGGRAQQPLSCPRSKTIDTLPADRVSGLQGAGTRGEKLQRISSKAESPTQRISAWTPSTHLRSDKSFSLHCLCYFVQYSQCVVFHIIVLILAQIYMLLLTKK